MSARDEAKEIALMLFPEKWIESATLKGFKIDNNAGRRNFAEDIALHFLSAVRSEDTAMHVMKAFYRREHSGLEPSEEEAKKLTYHMMTSLMAIDFCIKESIKNAK